MQTQDAGSNKPKRKVVFNTITLLTDNGVKLKKVVVNDKPKAFRKKKISPLEKKYENQPLIGDLTNLPVEDGSIQQFLNYAHPEVKKFLESNPIRTVAANCTELRIKTKTGFYMVITPFERYRSKIVIRNQRRKVIVETISSSRIEKTAK